MSILLDSDELLPFYTGHLEGIGGVIKEHPEDFVVEEVPLYEPSGEGTHVYAWMEKKGISTMDAVNRLARQLKVPARNIGYAGLKDSHAITRQWISVEHINPEVLDSAIVANIKILKTSRHKNKLKLGHLKSNRFRIRVRKLVHPAKDYFKPIMDVMDFLTTKGVPNYYGPQRFGNRCDSQLLGACIIQRNPEQFMDLFLGFPDSYVDNSLSLVARSYYQQNEFQKAFDTWPKTYQAQRRALGPLIKGADGDLALAKERAFNKVDKHLKRFFVSAFQSEIFNKVLARRCERLDKILDGDLAWIHQKGACFLVEDADLEQKRCDQFEISASGPLYGYKMAQPQGEPAEMEKEVLDEYKLDPQDFRQMNYYKVKGARRPLRFRPTDISLDSGHDQPGPYLQISFELPSGCYATTILREIIKPNAKGRS